MERHFSLILDPDAKKSMFEVLLFIQNVGIGEVWHLRYMQLGIEKSVYVLYLSIDDSDARHHPELFSTVNTGLELQNSALHLVVTFT
jgi:hypothetical protein